MPNSLKKYLDINFPDLLLRTGLFYLWDIGLRFDLQTENPSTYDKEYFEHVINRATKLFESVFDDKDQIIIVYQEYCYIKTKIRKGNYLFKQIKDLHVSNITFKKFSDLSVSPEKYDKNNKLKGAIVETTANKINYENIFTAIANIDFPPTKPRLKGYTFFINKTKNLIFHMYDDRGLDIISNDIEILRPTYITYNDWILDYDRNEIDKDFKVSDL